MEDNPIPDPFDKDEPQFATTAFDNANMSPLDEGDTSGRPLVWLMLGIIAMCSGVFIVGAFFYYKPDMQALAGKYFPSPTLTPSFTPTTTFTPTLTPTATLTFTPTITPTPNLTETQQALDITSTMEALAVNATEASTKWKLAYSDDFNSNKNDWLTGPSDDSYAKVDYSIANGKYTWEANSHQDFIGWVRISAKSYSNFYLTVEVTQHTDSESASTDCGLIFREDANGNFYYFGITSDQGYFLSLYHDNEWTNLLPTITSSLISTDTPNRLTIIAEGDHFSFFINDEFVVEMTDDTIQKGTNALAIELAPADAHAVYDFDNLEVRVK